ncbi:MAG: hypothetical protein ABTD50_16495 [Polyangiaceae bacterium]
MTEPSDLRRPPIRRTRAVNYGDRTTLRPGVSSQQLAWVSAEEAQAWVVYAQAQVTQPPVDSEFSQVMPFVELEWGHGGASVFATFPVVPGTPVQPGNVLRVPLAASMIKASGVLLDEGGGALDPSTPASAQLSCVIAPGFDGIPQVPTEWIPISGSNAAVTERPSKITHVFGHLITGATPLWIMLLDSTTAPESGTSPVLAAPVGSFPAAFDLTLPNSVPFSQGVWLALSTAADTLELALDASVFVRVERQLL